jgi:hypothetical protein
MTVKRADAGNVKATYAGGMRTGNVPVLERGCYTAPVKIIYGPNAPLQDERLRTLPLPNIAGHAKLRG